MARPVVLGNGSMMVGLNEHGLVHDFYYPYVGLENLTTARSVHHYIGVWVDGVFSWIDDGSWTINVDFENEALISKVTMFNQALNLEVTLQDFVDSEYNAFCRQIRVINNEDQDREVRVFMHQVFQISSAGRADTAMFVPEQNYILDYKGRCCLLIYGQYTDGTTFDQFATGNYGIEGKEGTFRDAEDGELSGSAVEHGGVDSVVRFCRNINAKNFIDIDYWIIAADSQFSAEKIHNKILDQSVANRLQITRQNWKSWINISSDKLNTISPEYQAMVKKSLLVIKAHADKRGGIIASGDSSIYNYGRDYYSYVWPRDGAYAIWPLIRLGYTEEAKKLFEFCRDIITPDGYLMHKYQPDRAIGSTWHPLLHGKHKELAIQEDETASILYMLGEYYQYSQDEDFVRGLYPTYVKPAANFLASFIDPETNLPHASYDLWEEKFLTSTYTTAVVYQALLVAEHFANIFEHPDDALIWHEAAESIKNNSTKFFDQDAGVHIKGYLLESDSSMTYDKTLDVSSFYGAFMYDLEVDKDSIRRSISNIEKYLLNTSPSGGSPRYVNDQYFRSNPPYVGNPWIVTTLWVAQYYTRVNKTTEAKALMDWAMKSALSSGVMSEQINPETSKPISVTPLVWSHAEFINTALDLAAYSKE